MLTLGNMQIMEQISAVFLKQNSTPINIIPLKYVQLVIGWSPIAWHILRILTQWLNKTFPMEDYSIQSWELEWWCMLRIIILGNLSTDEEGFTLLFSLFRKIDSFSQNGGEATPTRLYLFYLLWIATSIFYNLNLRIHRSSNLFIIINHKRVHKGPKTTDQYLHCTAL